MVQYKNGKEVLPPKLLLELQNYIQGELVYVPKKNSERAGWGERNGSRQILSERNIQIYQCYQDGLTVKELEEMYHLSADSIRKIIYKTGETVKH